MTAIRFGNTNEQQAPPWEEPQRPRLRHEQSKMHQARDLLAPVYGWFTEGFETRYLKEAKALLEELAGSWRWALK